MPTGASSSFGIVIISLGILGFIISFLITDRKKYLMALVLSGVVVFLGLFQSIQTSVRQWQASRRFTKLQEQQRLNLQALQERLRQAQAQAGVKAPAAKKTAPPPAPAAKK